MDRAYRPPQPRRYLPTGIFFVASLVLVFAQAMHEGLTADENVFVAGAALLGRNSALIYRDFHYNHMPTQVLIFAAIFELTGHLLMAARCFNVVCAVAMAVVLFRAAEVAFDRMPARRRLLFSSGIGLMLLFHPLFSFTSGKAWNHDLPALAGLLGLLALAYGLGRGRPGRWAAASGFCVAVAVTTRLTFAPAVLAFILYIVLVPGLGRAARLRAAALWGAGFLVAALPSIWVWSQAPAAAFFGNFMFPRLNTRFHVDNDTGRPFSVVGRAWYVLTLLVTLPGMGVVTLGFGCLAAAGLRPRLVRTSDFQCRLLCLLVLVLLLFAAGFAPAPMYRQYLYGPTPFILLGIVWCIAEGGLATRRWFPTAFGWAVAVCVVAGANRYNGLLTVGDPAQWVPLAVHADGDRIAGLAGRGRVLTLYPIYPLEGGADIYPELATGRFGLRVGKYLSTNQRLAYKMPNADDVAGWFETRPPDAVLIVWTNLELERAFKSIAEQREYRLTVLGRKRLLYRCPPGTGNDVISQEGTRGHH